MLELWKSLSDDQIALVGCAGALIVAGTTMSLSYYIGRARLAMSGQQSMSSPTPVKQPLRVQTVTSQPVATERRDAA